MRGYEYTYGASRVLLRRADAIFELPRRARSSARRVDARLIRISIRARAYVRFVHTRTYTCTYVRSILLSVRARPWAHRGLNNKTRIHTGNDRGEAPRGRGEGPAEPIKQVPDLSPSIPPRRAPPPSHSAAFPRAENARETSTGDPVREAASPLPSPPFPSLHPAVISSTRSPGLPGRARSWSCTTARSSSVRPLGDGRCIAPRHGVGAAW